MTGQLSKFLITLAQIANGIGAFITTADKVPFGLDASGVGLSLIWFGTFATICVVAIRGNWIPGIQTGIGNEAQGTTETTTLRTETKVNP